MGRNIASSLPQSPGVPMYVHKAERKGPPGKKSIRSSAVDRLHQVGLQEHIKHQTTSRPSLPKRPPSIQTSRSSGDWSVASAWKKWKILMRTSGTWTS